MKLVFTATSLCRGGRINRSFQSNSDIDTDADKIVKICEAYFIKVPPCFHLPIILKKL